jgi:hypothetical protein
MVNDVVFLTHPGGISHFNSQLRLSAHYISLADVPSPEYCSMVTMLVDLANSPDSSGGVVMSCGMNDPRFNSGQGQGIFHFSKMPRLYLGPTYSSQWVPGCFFLGGWRIKWLKCGFDHLLPFGAEVNKLIQADPPICSFSYPQFTMA